MPAADLDRYGNGSMCRRDLGCAIRHGIAKVRGYLVILVVALGIACGKAETPTTPAPGPVTSTSFGFFASGDRRSIGTASASPVAHQEHDAGELGRPKALARPAAKEVPSRCQ